MAERLRQAFARGRAWCRRPSAFLGDVLKLEHAGVSIRMPAACRAGRPAPPAALGLGAAELGQVLPPVFAYSAGPAAAMSPRFAPRPDVEGRRVPIPSPSEQELAVLATAAPMIPRAEYLAAKVLGALWEAIGEAFTANQAESAATVQEFLKRLNPAWNVVGGVHFNLAENRKDEEAP